jgi:FAD synthetase
MRVLAFGTYDILHAGHEYFLGHAKQFGEELFVVIARDETVLKVKGRLPHNKEDERRAAVERLQCVDRAVLGNPGDKYAVIEELKPDVIVLGYDQHTFTERLVEELNARGLNPKIVRIASAHEPEKYKSSKMRPE